MKVYLAGPMTGYLEHNYPAFYAGAACLEQVYGFSVVNPAALDVLTAEEIEDHGAEGGLGDGSVLPLYLRRDFKELVHCEGIVLLDGWADSAGANAELSVARFLDFEVYTLSERRGWHLWPSDAMPNTGIVRDTWTRFGIPVYQGQRQKERIKRWASQGAAT